MSVEFHNLTMNAYFGRHELLSMVKKHSALLGKGTLDERDASDVEMDCRFWYDMLDLYFIRCKESRGRQDDDLVFFVRNMVWLLFLT